MLENIIQPDPAIQADAIILGHHLWNPLNMSKVTRLRTAKKGLEGIEKVVYVSR